MSGIEKTLQMMKRQEEEKTAQSLARKYNLGYVSLINYPILYDVLTEISEEISYQYSIVSYLKVEGKLKVAITDPGNPALKQILAKIKQETKLNIILMVCSMSSLGYAQNLYQSFKIESKNREKVEVQAGEEKDFANQIKNLVDLKERIAQVPTTQLLEILFAGAVTSEASDIHLEPEERDLRLRYRIDGVLQDITKLPKEAEHVVTSRIKYLAKLKLDVVEQPQDGRFDVTAGGIEIDIRTSVIPSAFGETIVMRLLPKNKKFLTLEKLGFRKEYIEIIHKAIAKPNGIIFNTGPTGSGKTTTNYAILAELNKPGIKIITLEDPIEYRIVGIDQSQIESEKGYTFSAGLRSALRQDPDIIMVGEIRDGETATIAMQAAMTGHLVLTTLHTNNAPGAIPRLLDMDVKPYLLAGSVNLIIAQRLIRTIHKECAGKGCTLCNNTGYKGRTTISELLVPNEHIEKLIQTQASLAEFYSVAKEIGMMTMRQDGLDKVKLGITTMDEINRVTQEQD